RGRRGESGQPRCLGRLGLHNLARLPEQDRPAAALLSLDRLLRQAPASRPSFIAFDDADCLLGHPSSGACLARLMTLMAGRRLGLTLTAADVAGVLARPLGEA